MQTVDKYQEALLLGQKAFEAQDHVNKPLPHIFGSAAYLRDPQAGLGILPSRQDAVAGTTTESQLSRDQDEERPKQASQPILTHPAPSIVGNEIAAATEQNYQPQNFKAMLEAALKGEGTLNTAEQHKLADEEHLPRLWQKSDAILPDDTLHKAVPDRMLAASDQPAENRSQESVPQVLAWLEQGRGLFDYDDNGDDVSEI